VRLDGTGRVDHVFGVERLAGSEFADILIGSNGPDMIFGQGGDNSIYGLDGEDLLLAEGGDDFLDGGPPGIGDANDPDLLFGRGGFDTCINGNAFGHTADDEPSCESTSPL
jgi:Ca2+-binding RTX toxin-like protein